MKYLGISMAFILSCLWLAGCVANKSGRTAVTARQQPTAAQIEIREEHYPDGAIRVRREGILDESGEFIPHGKLFNFWENGQKKSELTFVQGLWHGPRTSWYQTGQVRAMGQNINGVADGTWTEWYPDGRKMREMHFVHGAFHGVYVEWYDDGQKRREFEYVNGKIQGTETIWDEEGNIVQQNEYVDSVRQP